MGFNVGARALRTKQKIAIYNPYLTTMGGGEKVVLVMAEHLSKSYEVTLIARDKVDLKEIEKYFSVDLGEVKLLVMNRPSIVMRFLTTSKLPWPGRWRNIMTNYADIKQLKKVKMDIFINSLYGSSLHALTSHSLYICNFPHQLPTTLRGKSFIKKIYNGALDEFEGLLTGNRKEAIDSYSLIIANSLYTKGWIEKRWGKDSVVLYPICENMGPAQKKDKIILNVGRFFADNGESHHKRQDLLIKSFAQMKELHSSGWVLHLVGSTADDAKSREYIEKVKKLARDWPVELHFNTSFEELRDLYQKASIYWHATGYGFDANKLPQTQEHFGITTVEAMSAGAVPVVVNAGGQPETVDHEKNGYLWDNIEQLQAYTIKVARNPSLRNKLSKAAMIKSQRYNKASFNKSLDKIMGQLELQR